MKKYTRHLLFNLNAVDTRDAALDLLSQLKSANNLLYELTRLRPDELAELVKAFTICERSEKLRMSQE